uniref:Putative transposase n=1 Tax=Streptomyces hygroscopicus TaxID=1912 RepID=D5MEH0_STRHY|nr:putative transposase [Streptomyces hygroscopicus]
MSNGRCGRRQDHHQVVNGALYRIRTGMQWRDLPDRHAPWKTVDERHRRWSMNRTWEVLLRQVEADSGLTGPPDHIGPP